MKVHSKTVEGFNMKVWNDSNVSWAIQSNDTDGYVRTQHYAQNKFTMKDAIRLHNDLYRNM